MEGEFPVFDPQNCPVYSNYSEPLQLSEVSRSLIELKDSTAPNEEKIPKFAQSIESLHLTLENSLYNIENNNKDVSIQTLPHNTGNDHELISVIQPTAWILADEGCYYDPVECRIVRNLVGYWDGVASSLSSRIFHLFTNGCFMSYHITALISVILAFIMKFVLNQRTLTMVLLIAAAVGYDLIAMLFIVFAEIYSKDSGNPRLADKIQKQAKSAITYILSQMVSSIPSQLMITEGNNKKQTVSQISGNFLLKYFYEPVSQILAKEVANTSSALYSKNKAKTKSWKEIENLLILYRFVREISQSYPPESEQISNTISSNMKLLIQNLIKEGDQIVHIQLLRLLYKSTLSPSDRSQIIKDNYRDLSLNHYIGTKDCEYIISELQKEVIKKSKSAASQTTDAIKYTNIANCINVSYYNSSFTPSSMIPSSRPIKHFG